MSKKNEPLASRKPTLCTVALALVEAFRNRVTIDWTQRETTRGRIRVAWKRLLRKHGYHSHVTRVRV